jgi:cobalt-zinc-cadmium efflux system membrane fusion protein
MQTTDKSEVPQSVSASATTAPRSSSYFARIAFAVVLASAAAAGYYYLGHTEAKSNESAPVAKPENEKADPGIVKIDEKQKGTVNSQAVEAKSFQAEQVCTGKIAFNDDLTTPVFAEYTGRVTKVFVKPGETVQKGAPLYEIDTPDLVQVESDLVAAVSSFRKAGNALRLATASKEIASRNNDISQRNIEIAGLSAKLAQSNQERQKQLVEDKAVSQKDYEQAQRDMQAALRDAEQAKKDLEQAKKDAEQSTSDIEAAKSDLAAGEHLITAIKDRLRGVFGKTDAAIEIVEKDRVIDRITQVKAPISGTITARKIGLGQYIKPDNSDPLFTITDLSSMWLVADVYEVDAPKIKIGQLVEVRALAFPNEVFQAKVTYIGPSVNPDSRRVSVRCEIPNAKRELKSEMFVTFKIWTGDRAPSVSVAANAIVQEGDKQVVFVEKSATEFIKRVVRTGMTEGNTVQILDGLQSGERVVNQGAIFLSNASGN